MSQLWFIVDATEDGNRKIWQFKSMQDQTGLATVG